MDVTRYRLDPPPLERKNDVGAWRRALDNAHSQLEHQYNRCSTGPAAWVLHSAARHCGVSHLLSVHGTVRAAVSATICISTFICGMHDGNVMTRPVAWCRLMNLELLLKFGPAAWKVHNASLEAHNSRCAAMTRAMHDLIVCTWAKQTQPVDYVQNAAALKQHALIHPFCRADWRRSQHSFNPGLTTSIENGNCSRQRWAPTWRSWSRSGRAWSAKTGRSRQPAQGSRARSPVCRVQRQPSPPLTASLTWTQWTLSATAQTIPVCHTRRDGVPLPVAIRCAPDVAASQQTKCARRGLSHTHANSVGCLVTHA